MQSNPEETVKLEPKRKLSTLNSTWRGAGEIKHFVIFGDSYSDIGWHESTSKNGRPPHPDIRHPLGVKYPGLTFAGDFNPNWVGYLIHECIASKDVLVHCYAKGGATVDGIKSQVENSFLPDLGTKPNWARWTAHNSLFVTWVGINDCAYALDFDEKMTSMIECQEKLYRAGARNFLFIDIPPINLSPAGRRYTRLDPSASKSETYAQKFKTWNLKLAEYVQKFSEAHTHEITTMIYSSYDIFSDALAVPRRYGLKDDISGETSEERKKTFVDMFKRAGGENKTFTSIFKRTPQEKRSSVWFDPLHPSTAMHEIIANDLYAFLTAQPADVDGVRLKK